MMNICVFEDVHYKNFMPLTFSKPTYALRIGFLSLLNRIQTHFPSEIITLHCRDYLKTSLQHTHAHCPINYVVNGRNCLFINGRTLMNTALAKHLCTYGDQANYILMDHRGDIIAIHVNHELTPPLFEKIMTFTNPTAIIDWLRSKCTLYNYPESVLIHYPWECINANTQQLTCDFHDANRYGLIKSTIDPLACIHNENHIFIDHNTIIEPFVYLNATNGPIYIENNVHIHSHSRLEGPLYIGNHTHILGGNMAHCSINHHCKIKGDISHSIVHSYSNKAHDGYIGHSYIGNWVNLGAATTISNLKNTYGTIRTQQPDWATPQDTKQQFLGAIIGDHVKTGIGSLISAGTHIGYGTSIYGSTIHHGTIPVFSWGQAPHYETYQFSSFLNTAQRMMQRRDIDLRVTDKKLMAILFETHATTPSSP